VTRVLDGLRRKLGMKTSAQVDFEAASTRARLAAARVWQTCPVCGCVPVNEVGVPVPVSVRRWWCEAHRDQAAPGDLQSYTSGIRLSESGVLVPAEDREWEKIRAEEAIRRQRHERRLAERKLEAERMRREREARDEAFRRELPPGIPG
jgi:hypothetical protein